MGGWRLSRCFLQNRILLGKLFKLTEIKSSLNAFCRHIIPKTKRNFEPTQIMNRPIWVLKGLKNPSSSIHDAENIQGYFLHSFIVTRAREESGDKIHYERRHLQPKFALVWLRCNVASTLIRLKTAREMMWLFSPNMSLSHCAHKSFIRETVIPKLKPLLTWHLK